MIPIDIWVVEDDAGYRRILKQILNGEEHITCSRVFPSCDKLFEAIEAAPHPDLVLMDLGLPGMGGVDGIQKLRTIAPNVTVIVLTVFGEKEKVLESLDAGAAGYLLKTATPQEIIDGLQSVFMGGAALSPSVAKLVIEEFRKPKSPEQVSLTDREIEVLQLLSGGIVKKEISTKLHISTATVDYYLRSIYQKLQVHSQAGAVGKAIREGMI